MATEPHSRAAVVKGNAATLPTNMERKAMRYPKFALLISGRKYTLKNDLAKNGYFYAC